MKKFLVLAVLCAIVGCGGSEQKSVVEGVELSEIEQYEKMAAESAAATGESIENADKDKTR